MISAPDLKVIRCRDHRLIERLLSEDYFDSPICYFPKSLVRVAAHWLAASDDVFFMVAFAGERVAGMYFAHTIGPAIWKRFVVERPWLLPLAACVVARRNLRSVRGKVAARFSHARPKWEPGKVGAMDFPCDPAPFSWARPDTHTMYGELLHVATDCRGQGVGPMLLRSLHDEMRARDIRVMEGHVDSANYASLRALQKAGWSVTRMGGGDFKVTYRCTPDEP